MHIVQYEKDISRQTNYTFQNPLKSEAYLYAKHIFTAFKPFRYEKQDGKEILFDKFSRKV